MTDNLTTLRNNIVSEIENTNSIFEIKPASKWIEKAKSRPIPRKLFGEFWLEGEVCILFSDTYLGKSILAVQIANIISNGIYDCGLKLECPPTPVIYFDFELSDKQFENRYSENFKNHYLFNSNFFRAEINPDTFTNNDKVNFEEFLYASLEKSVSDERVKVIIIDNITYLKNETKKAKDTLPLTKHLKELKNKYGLSILVLAHTPKRDVSKPITKNDLSRSKMLMNFCDSSFTICESHHDNGLRYLKQIKQRNTEQIYDAENVIACQIEKVNSFLQLSFVDFGSEFEHLKQITSSDRNERDKKIFELKETGISKVEIGRQLFISESMVRKILKLN